MRLSEIFEWLKNIIWPPVVCVGVFVRGLCLPTSRYSSSGVERLRSIDNLLTHYIYTI